ncbi:MaoC/PaaZ C-terminal domain-containing protein [Variovorax boronicumulans]|uniref:MaoC/PaaZ C-terminal domain-containing protein n=1 Tax=Variovorax boronicumulans TaxID=436515 RepID=UPI001C569DA2
MLDYERLLHYPVPEVRQRYTRRDAALYALSVGFAQDPMDERQLRFVDLRDDMLTTPSFALVLGYPGFWLARPDTGVDASRVVHGEQHVELMRPLPAEGEIVGRTEITRIIDRGIGKGALLYSRRTLLDARTGEPLALTRATMLLRGEGGFGGPAGPVDAPHPMPGDAPDFVCELATRPEQALYYRLNGDENRIHADPSAARAAGFERPILHGMCTYGFACHALLRTLQNYDPRAIRSMGMRFTTPVFPGETLRVEIWKDGSFRVKVPERGVVVVDNGCMRRFGGGTQ